MEEFPASMHGAPTTCKLTYREVSQQKYLQTLRASLVVAKGHNSDLLSGRGGGFRKDRCGKKGDFFAFSEGGWRWGWGRNFWQKSVTYSRHQFPSDTDNIFFPAKLSAPEHIISSKSSSQQKLTWRTDILRNRSIGCPCFSFACTLLWINKIPVLARGGGTHGCRDRHFVHRAPMQDSQQPTESQIIGICIRNLHSYL